MLFVIALMLLGLSLIPQKSRAAKNAILLIKDIPTCRTAECTDLRTVLKKGTLGILRGKKNNSFLFLDARRKQHHWISARYLKGSFRRVRSKKRRAQRQPTPGEAAAQFNDSGSGAATFDDGGSAGGSGASRGMRGPKFHWRLVFDFWFGIPLDEGEGSNVQEFNDGPRFGSYHNYLFASASAPGDITISGQLGTGGNSGETEILEIAWNPSHDFDLRFGKIQVPFDNFNKHPLFGGVIHLGNPFLPFVWTDLGVSAHKDFEFGTTILETHLYVLNGFANNSGLGTGTFPNDTNNAPVGRDNISGKGAKAYGARTRLHLGASLKLGASAYFDKWEQGNISMYGFDIESTHLFGIPIDFMMGAAAGSVDTNAGGYGRIGYYAQTTVPTPDFIDENTEIRWKLGGINPSDEVTNDAARTSSEISLIKKFTQHLELSLNLQQNEPLNSDSQQLLPKTLLYTRAQLVF
jgi:hypothetical protein